MDMRRAFLVFTLLVVMAGCGSSHWLELTPELEHLLELINAQRAEGYTCASGYMPPAAPLTADGRLNWAAQMHAEDLDASGELDDLHTSPPGAIHFSPGTPSSERLIQAGYLYSAMGENVVRGVTTPEEALAAWLASDAGHCEGLMRATYVHAGLGKSGAYWVLDMAAPQ